MSPTITVASFFSAFRQTTECMRSGEFVYRTTKLVARPTRNASKLVQSVSFTFFQIFLSPKGPPFKFFDILQQTEV